MDPSKKKFIVYYDGLCVICSREIDFYRKKDGAGQLSWIDICDPSFDAKSHGLDPKEVHRLFHVKTEDERIIQGVDGFIEIWKRIPSLRILTALAKIPGLKPLLKLGYKTFIRVRPLLPRKKEQKCNSEYCEINSKMK